MANKTIPRCPPAAAYGTSPGPGKYGLPGIIGRRDHDPRSVHFKGPGWVFGTKHGKFRDDCSPGPKYDPGRQTRHGGDGAQKYSLYSRARDPSTFKTPGAGAYRPEEHCAVYHKAPIFSFGSRHRSRRTDDTPGPNRYSLPNMLGKTPQSNKVSMPGYSLSGRSKQGSFHEDLTHTPGPGTYKITNPDIFKDALPRYSMIGRNSMPGDTTTKPGPGAHSPETRRAQTAGPSFGIRHSPYIAPLIVEVCD
ncbi:ciliary microtubule associated protein 1A-like isoform X2 [Tubulanus polymorphus]|uniref:ciliary microtubule associated protein 1A-like isoform X2 n=1 Tax=Tubulanus polymorphus TaxID=672921 RepID=UPI003DA37036